MFFLPANIYLTLTVGGGAVATASTFLIVILFGEIARYFGKPLTRHELFIMFSVITVVTALIPPYYWLIWRDWYVRHPLFSQTFLFGQSLFDIIPSWFVPKDPAILSSRTFFQSAWVIPLTVQTIIAILSFIQSLSLALIFGYTFVEVENLDFPAGKVQASLILTLTERSEEYMRIFMFALMLGVGFGAVIYLPSIIGSPIFPLPWADFTAITQDFLPGAIVGLSTDPQTYIVGMIIPINVAVCVLVASVVVYIMLNHVFLRVLPQVFPEWVNEFYYGMRIATLQYRSYLRIWLPIQFGMTMGMAIMFTLVIRKQLYRALQAFLKASKRAAEGEAGFPSLPWVLLLFLGSSLGSSLLFIYLVPEFNPFVAIGMSLGYSFLVALVTARALGIGAVSPGFAYPWRIITYFSDYKGFIAYEGLVSPAVEMGHSAQMIQSIKVAYLTETKPMDYFKLLIVGYLITLFISLIFLDFFWRIAPIPSGIYPYTLLFWPQYMLEVLMFSTERMVIKPEIILISMAIAMIFVGLESGLRRLGLAFSAIGIFIGISSAGIPPIAIAYLIGSLISNIIMPKITSNWKNMLYPAMAGLTAGLSISVGLGIAVSLLLRSSWVWPW